MVVLVPRRGILKLPILDFFLYIFCLIYFNFILLLSEGRAGEAWVPSKNVILSPSLARMWILPITTPLSHFSDSRRGPLSSTVIAAFSTSPRRTSGQSLGTF
jgi:hypothetical protein